MEKKITKWIGAAVGVIVLALLLGGVVNKGDVMYHLKDRGALGPLTRDDIAYLEVDAPEASSNDGTVNASDWADVYPEIVATMG